MIGQAFLLHKSMLANPNDQLVLNMVGNGFQEDLICHLSREYSEADWAVVLWIFLLAVLEDRSDICFFSVLRKLPPSP